MNDVMEVNESIKVQFSDSIHIKESDRGEKLNVFETEFMPHLDAMYNFAFRLTYDDDAAKDLITRILYLVMRQQ